jgi:hypothetical protein
LHTELDEELRKLRKGTRKGNRKWPRKKLLELVVEAGSFANRKHPDPNWPILTALMVSIYRDESAKIQAIDSYNLTAGQDTPKGIGARTKSGKLLVPDTEDDEDFD